MNSINLLIRESAMNEYEKTPNFYQKRKELIKKLDYKKVKISNY